jgi:ribosomal-protein-alanine N-acetyltransferase
MKIKPASKEDAKIIYEIESIVFKGDAFALSKASIMYHLKCNTFFIAYEKDIALGYLLWLKRKSYFRLYSMAVLPEYRDKKVGSKLLEFSLQTLTCKDFSLEVKQTNEKAINLYKKFGFKIVKNLKDYYEDGDGFLMQLRGDKVTQAR